MSWFIWYGFFFSFLFWGEGRDRGLGGCRGYISGVLNSGIFFYFIDYVIEGGYGGGFWIWNSSRYLYSEIYLDFMIMIDIESM